MKSPIVVKFDEAITEVVRVPKSAIRAAPGLFDGKAPFFLGVCEYQGRELILLNVKSIIGSDEEIDAPTPSAVLTPEELT